MCPKFNNNLVIKNMDIRMVSFAFGNFGSFIYKRYRLFKILEFKLFSNFFAVNNLPAAGELGYVFLNFFGFKRRGPALAGNTFFIRKKYHLFNITNDTRLCQKPLKRSETPSFLFAEFQVFYPPFLKCPPVAHLSLRLK